MYSVNLLPLSEISEEMDGIRKAFVELAWKNELTPAMIQSNPSLVNAVDERNFGTAIMWTIHYKNTPSFDALLATPNINLDLQIANNVRPIYFSGGTTALIISAGKGSSHDEFSRKLIFAGANVSLREGKLGKSALDIRPELKLFVDEFQMHQLLEDDDSDDANLMPVRDREALRRHQARQQKPIPSEGIAMPECSICMEIFTHSGEHEAKICPCGHTYCLQCLRSLATKACPTCRAPYGNNADALPRNFQLLELISSLSQSSSANPKKRKFSSEELRAQLREREKEEREEKLNELREELSSCIKKEEKLIATAQKINRDFAELSKLDYVNSSKLKKVQKRMRDIESQIETSN